MSQFYPENTLLQAIVDAIPDMIIRIGRDRVFRSFEDNVMDLYWPVDTYVGKTIEEVMPGIAAESFSDAIEKAFTSEQVQQLEYSLTINDKIQHYESRMAKCNAEELIVIVRNVTHERETEQELRKYQSRPKQQMEVRSTDLSADESKYWDIFNHSGAPSPPSLISPPSNRRKKNSVTVKPYTAQSWKATKDSSILSMKIIVFVSSMKILSKI